MVRRRTGAHPRCRRTRRGGVAGGGEPGVRADFHWLWPGAEGAAQAAGDPRSQVRGARGEGRSLPSRRHHRTAKSWRMVCGRASAPRLVPGEPRGPVCARRALLPARHGGEVRRRPCPSHRWRGGLARPNRRRRPDRGMSRTGGPGSVLFRRFYPGPISSSYSRYAPVVQRNIDRLREAALAHADASESATDSRTRKRPPRTPASLCGRFGAG